MVASWGILQGTNQHCVQLWSATGRSSNTFVARRAFSDRVGFVSNAGGGVTVLQATASAIADGIAVTFTGNQSAYRLGYLAFAGSDTQAKSGVIALGTGTSAITVSGVGFQPDVIILMSHNDDIAAGETNLLQGTFGFATSDGTQRSVGWVEVNSETTGKPWQALLTDCGAQAKLNTNSSQKMVIGGFGSDGFTVTPSTSQGSDDLIYLALKFTGRAVKIIDFTTPTSTGTQSITGVGFTPQAAIVVLTNLEAVDSQSATSTDQQGGLSISLLGDEVLSTSWRIDSGASVTSTGSQSIVGSVIGPSAIDEDAAIATAAFTSGGMTLNYSAVQATGKKGFILFIE